MKKILILMIMTISAVSADAFEYANERFADLQMLRYRLNGFENLTPQQKALIYYLSEASLWGRDITTDQQGKYNIRLRKVLEPVYKNVTKKDASTFDADEKAFVTYMKQVWFSNGIYHHYSKDKFIPAFSEKWFRKQVSKIKVEGKKVKDMDLLCKVIFDPTVLPKGVNLSSDVDVVVASAHNFYGEGVTQKEAEDFYAKKKAANKNANLPMYGLNSTLIKKDGKIVEDVWKVGGKYGKAIGKIVENLEKAIDYAENEKQKEVIEKLIKYYHTGDVEDFDDYSVAWVGALDGMVDFVCGFIETYGDPLGMKGTYEGIVQYKDLEATKRTQTISTNAQWFEDHSPVEPRFRKPKVKGVIANVINAAILAGDEYPSTAIGINLPNSDWIRAQHGSKSVTIGNITDAYNKAAHGNGFSEEFVIDEETRQLMEKYGDMCDYLHTDLHECLGHASGQLMPGTDPDALKNYSSTNEETRADLFALYYLADPKLIELGLLPNEEAYKASYYSQMNNGLITQLVRIKPGDNIEEAHMRNRALIANWCFEHGKKDNVMELVKKDGKTFLRINDYKALRGLVAQLLAEIQRVKSEGDFETCKNLVETYGVKVNQELHKEVLERYAKLNLAPYKGFINPVMTPVFDEKGRVIDVKVDYTEPYDVQMLRYSEQYATE
ncbi:MAG: dihydrofolate reductase [Prevotella sp.]|nr:dihydrofolate reductase [Candidatus Equicola stercoris]